MTSRSNNNKEQILLRVGSRRDSFSSANSNDQPKIVRINDRVNTLQSHADIISNNYQQVEPHIASFVSKIQQVASQLKPNKEKKSTQIPMAQNDFKCLHEEYIKIINQLKGNPLVAKCNEVDQLIQEFKTYINQAQGQMSIRISEMELLLKEGGLVEYAKRDHQLELIKEEFLLKVLDDFETTLERERDNEHTQIRMIEQQIDQMEQELDTRFENVELQSDFINEFIKNGSEESKLHDTVRQWMLQQAREIEVKCEQEAQRQFDVQYKEFQNKSHLKLNSLHTTIQNLKKQTSELTKSPNKRLSKVSVE